METLLDLNFAWFSGFSPAWGGAGRSAQQLRQSHHRCLKACRLSSS
jgi:hypothetical protein